MSELLVGLLLFTILVLGCLCMLLVLFHIRTQRELTATLRDLMESQADGFSKLLQTALLHLKSATPSEAVSLQVALEREQAVLDSTINAVEQQIEKEEPRPKAKRPIGYKGPDGRVYKFMHDVKPEMLAGIDQSRLVYNE